MTWQGWVVCGGVWTVLVFAAGWVRGGTVVTRSLYEDTDGWQHPPRQKGANDG